MRVGRGVVGRWRSGGRVSSLALGGGGGTWIFYLSQCHKCQRYPLTIFTGCQVESIERKGNIQIQKSPALTEEVELRGG
jgi:hypothetical protein